VPAKPQVVDLSSGKTQCHTEHVTVWDTRYEETLSEECTTEQVNRCTTEYKEECKQALTEECSVVIARQCNTVESRVCREHSVTETVPVTETRCTTLYKQDCESRWEGEGDAKVWVIIPETCKTNPYEKCDEVVTQSEHSVPKSSCIEVPEEVCVSVPVQKCRKVPRKQCSQEPWTFCSKVPEQRCETVHKRVPHRVSKTVHKKVCSDNTGNIVIEKQGDSKGTLDNIIEEEARQKSKDFVFEED